MYVLLSFVTFSVYHFYFMDLWAKDVNILCEKDGKHTVGVEKMMLFSVLTFGVYKYVWLAEIVDRICDMRRNTMWRSGRTAKPSLYG